MADGSTKPIEEVKAGDELRSYEIAGLGWDPATRQQTEWKQFHTDGEPDLTLSMTHVRNVLRNTFHAHFVINGGVRATYEHPFLAMRNGAALFIRCSGLRVGDLLFKNGAWIAVATIDRMVGEIETWNLDVEPLDLFIVDGFLVHNTTIKT